MSAITFYMLVIALCNTLFCQDGENGDYELLLLEIDVLRSYSTFSKNTNTLIDSAKEQALKGDYDIAIVFLEEAKSEISILKKKINPKAVLSSKKTLFFNFLTGIDYNRQEFELGFEQSDSVLLDELSKPFVGFNLKYLNAKNTFQIENRLRYDKENLQTELFLKNTSQNNYFGLNTKIGTVYDKNFAYSDLGYLEFFADLNFKSIDLNYDWYWSIKNLTRYKKFKQATQTIPNFIRNTFSTYVVRNFDLYKNLQFDYNFDFNESLQYINNDFKEHDAGISYQDIFLRRLKFKVSTRSRISNFNYLVQDNNLETDIMRDSSFTNRSNTYFFNPNFIFEINSDLSIDLNYKADFKSYDIKTEQEPDYTFQYVNPAFIINFNEMTRLKVGYVFEEKVHKTEPDLEKQYIKDQNYSSKGISTGVDYSSLSGIIISLNAEYMLRRYPNVQDDVSFSIYSNRNVLNILFFAQIPVSEKMSLNAIASYDNDKDIDSDFNDSISSFYTFEVSYSF